MITSTQVKEIRERTNCGIVDCKQALEESKGDLDKAIAWLRTKGKASASKKANRTTGEGYVAHYIHSNQKLGVIVSLLCETDFVARNEKFQELAKDIAMHIAASEPLAVRPEDIPADLVQSEKAIAEQNAKDSDKPAEIQAKMIEGRIKKFTEEKALLTQNFVKDPSKKISDLLTAAVSELGENITVGGFSRLTI